MERRRAVRAGIVNPAHMRGMARFWLALGVLSFVFAVLPAMPTLVFLGSAAAHECGHIGAMALCGVPRRGMRLMAGGAVLDGEFLGVPFGKELLCAAAGPAVNILLAVLCSGSSTVCAVNILLAVYNLLPLDGNDGAVMLYAAAGMCGAEDAMRRLLRVVGQVLWAVLLMLSAWVFWYGALADQRGGSVGYGALFFCVLLRGIRGVR